MFCGLLRILRVQTVLLILLLSGCAEKVKEQTVISEPVLTRQYRQGALTVIVSVSETNITTAGRLRFQVDVQAPPGDEVGIPDLEAFIDPFTVSAGYSEPVQGLPNGKQLYRRVWELVPSLPGITVFQPIEIMAGPFAVQTDPIPVGVTSLLPEGLDTRAIRDIAQPMERLPEEEIKRAWILYSTIGLTVVILFLLARKYSKRKSPGVARPPHEIALQALDTLPDDDLAALHELTHILRTYIQARSGLPLSGKTAQQIVAMMGPAKRLSGVDGEAPALPVSRELLAFLETAEQARFSRQVPGGFIRESENRIRRYIESTREVPECA